MSHSSGGGGDHVSRMGVGVGTRWLVNLCDRTGCRHTVMWHFRGVCSAPCASLQLANTELPTEEAKTAECQSVELDELAVDDEFH